MNAHIVSVTDFGAEPDGKTLNTAAIQGAIDAVAAAGGGRVVVPPGIFRTGTLELRSHIDLHLLPGAVLLGSPRLEDYTAFTWGHHADRTPYHLIYANQAKNISISGTGAIRGNGPAFWEPERPGEDHFWREKLMRPSPMVEISHCEDVRITDVTLGDASGWTLHLLNTDRAVVRGIRIDTDLLGPNGDGIDVTGCHDLIISDCHISCGDDAIALKTTYDSRTCERVAVTNCILETNCVAVRIGAESIHDFRDITISNCVVTRCSRGFDFRPFQGCTIERVTVSNIVGSTNCGWPYNRVIEMDANLCNRQWKVPPEHSRFGAELEENAIERPGTIRNVTFANIAFETDGRIMVGAIPGAECRNITMRDVRLHYPMIDDPSYAPSRNHMFFKGLDQLVRARAAVAVDNVENFVLSGLTIDWPSYPVPKTWRLLRSAHRACSPAVYHGSNTDAIRAGDQRVPFHAVWGRGLRGGIIRVPGATASEAGVDPVQVDNSSVKVYTNW